MESSVTCPHCQNDDPTRLEDVTTGPKHPGKPTKRKIFCGNCARTFIVEV